MYYKKFLVFTVLITLCLAFSSTGSALEISGFVTDAVQNPLAGVSVTSDVKGVGTVTDVDGKYTLPFNVGIKQLMFSSIGYKPISFLLEELPMKITLQPVYYRSADILVTSDRAEAGITPIAFENISADIIERDYAVGEFPLLLQSTPNLLSFSDGGASLGYSYTRIRGFDDKQIVTYINGVPLNDPEDHATYFVDLPDFPANVSDIQVQRGVGNSLYGDASFGGTINIVTSAFDSKRSASIKAGYGEYENGGDVYKQSVEFSSGLVDGTWAYNGRFSKQKSGGYKYNSWYEGWSYYFSIGKIDPNMTTELYVYGGPVRMHLSYWGAPRDEIAKDRKYNPLTYSNETDNFNQPHYHLHNVYRLNENTTVSNTLYYIRGKGYYEQYKSSRTFADYNIESFSDSTEGDLVRQQWVEKNQYGWNPRLDIEHEKGKHSIGGSIYLFESDHWGQVVWAQYITGQLDPRARYYQYYGDKLVSSFFIQEYYQLSEKLSTQITAQMRYQKYTFDSDRLGAFAGYDYDLDWLFLSPRIGFTYQLNKTLSFFTNFAIASRAPNDDAIYNANDPDVEPSLDDKGEALVQSEKVYDLELGSNYSDSKLGISLNFFGLLFQDEILAYDIYDYLEYSINIDKTVHAGIELSSIYRVSDDMTVQGNYSYNYNRVQEFVNDLGGIEVDFKDKTIPFFPSYIGNIIFDYKLNDLRLTYKHKLMGKQYMDLYNIESNAIAAVDVGAVSASYLFADFLSMGNVVIQFRIDNIFNRKYEISGYGDNYAYNDGTNDIVEGWAEYFVAPERSVYGQLKLELF